MNRTLMRMFVAVGVAAGFLTVTATEVGAGTAMANHSEPALLRNETTS